VGLSSCHPVFYDIVVIGAGVAGVSAVHHLVNSFSPQGSNVRNQYSSSPTSVHVTPTTAAAAASVDRLRPKILIIDAGPAPGEGPIGSRKSGTATLKSSYAGGTTPGSSDRVYSRIKMMTQIYTCDSGEFVKHHGVDGARRYMHATKVGLALQKKLAMDVCNGKEILSEMGSYYVCADSQRDELKAEYDFLCSLGEECCNDLVFIENIMDHNVPGASPDYPCAIYFPSDAVIDSSEYTKRLLHKSLMGGRQGVALYNTRVVNVDDDPDVCTITLHTGDMVFANHVVLATGAMDPLPQLNGLIVPCYSYLAHVPVSTEKTVQQSANFFTWTGSSDLGVDWCFDQGKVRVSGEDHFSAYKEPKLTERCGRMINWAQEKYGRPSVVVNEEITQQYGIYSETPDLVPLVGTRRDDSRICYLVGCNAAGQTILSYAASLVPNLLGYCGGVKQLDESQRDALCLLSIRRFAELPSSY
jgi:glycine/D-amino acid oxidase-like deaminating enzyme